MFDEVIITSCTTGMYGSCRMHDRLLDAISLCYSKNGVLRWSCRR